MFDKKSRVKIRSFHRWIAVVAGVQILLWVVSGSYFAWISMDQIKGESNKQDVVLPPLQVTDLYSPSHLQLENGFAFKSLKLEPAARGYIYRIESKSGDIKAFDAMTGSPQAMLSESDAREFGNAQLMKKSLVLSTELIKDHTDDYKGSIPAYKVQLDDFLNTRLYVDPWSGKLIVQRNALWRIYDFLWMLHIMDYSTREDFNNPWIRITSVLSLFVIGSGYLLFLFGKFSRKTQKS